MDALLQLAVDPTVWAALITLVIMEVVLGIDNLVFISILFVSPLFPQWRWWSSDEVNAANFTGPMILLSFVGVGLWWVASAKKWFTGPKVQGTPEELAAIEKELDALEHGTL